MPKIECRFELLILVDWIPVRFYHYRIGKTLGTLMTTKLSVKGQVTIPKQIRDALGLKPGMPVNFAVNRGGEVVIQRVEQSPEQKPDRFEAARGKADVKWRTQDLMALLRGEA